MGMNKSDLCERYLSWFWCRACSIHRGFSCSDALLPCHVPHQWVLHHRESSGGQDFLHSLLWDKYHVLDFKLSSGTLRHSYISLDPGPVGALLVGRGSSPGDSRILHIHTVSRHCHTGWSIDKDKRFSQFLSSQVATALVVVFGLFQIPCSGSLALFSILCLLQGDQVDR